MMRNPANSNLFSYFVQNEFTGVFWLFSKYIFDASPSLPLIRVLFSVVRSFDNPYIHRHVLSWRVPDDEFKSFVSK